MDLIFAPETRAQNSRGFRNTLCNRQAMEMGALHTCDSVAVSSSLSTAPGAGLLEAKFLRLAKLSSLFAFLISTNASSRRRLNSSGLKDCLALKLRL